MAPNLRAPLFLAQAFAAQLDENTGNIINVVDHKTTSLNPDYFSYTVAKIGMAGATRLLAMAFRGRIRSNAIAPGLVQATVETTGMGAANPVGRCGIGACRGRGRSGAGCHFKNNLVIVAQIDGREFWILLTPLSDVRAIPLVALKEMIFAEVGQNVSALLRHLHPRIHRIGEINFRNLLGVVLPVGVKLRHEAQVDGHARLARVRGVAGIDAGHYRK